MISVLLTVLKIIGIVLLVILGLVLCILLTVLLVPIRYQADVSYPDKPYANVQINWLLRLLRVRLSFEGKLRYSVKVLFFTLLSSEKKEKKKKKKKRRNSSGTEKTKEAEKVEGPDKVEEADKAEMPDKVEKPEKVEKAEKAEPAEKVDKPVKSEKTKESKKPKKTEKPEKKVKEKKPKKSLSQRLSSLWERFEALPDKWEAIQNKYDSLIAKKDEWMDFLEDRKNLKSFRSIQKRVIIMIKHTLPVKVSGYAKIGLDDPVIMGKICTAAAFIYPLYGSGFEFDPCFESTAPVIDLSIKGRLRLGVYVVQAIGIIFTVLINKNLRRKVLKLLH